MKLIRHGRCERKDVSAAKKSLTPQTLNQRKNWPYAALISRVLRTFIPYDIAFEPPKKAAQDPTLYSGESLMERTGLKQMDSISRKLPQRFRTGRSLF